MAGRRASATTSNGAVTGDPFAFPDAHFRTVLADPPWRFINRTGKVAPEHRRLSRYNTLTTEQICAR